jgi:isoquinoline 1-oxidoreductase beta subunit
MDGKPVGFNHQFIKAGGGSSRTASQPRNAQLDYSFAGATQMNGSAASPVPTGAWRSVDHSQVSPAIECFIDEMAHAAGKDPVAFRRENITDERLLKIIDLCVEKSGWNNPLPAGRYRGFACFNDYGGRAAHAVEIGIVDGAIKVYRAVCCVDTGFSINPNGVKQQMEGACMDAIATTLFAEITIENGGVVQGTPYEYEWARLMHAPAIEVHIVEGGTEPCGMGEIGYPAVPAAIANAVFAATGKRVRKFPIKLDELV